MKRITALNISGLILISLFQGACAWLRPAETVKQVRLVTAEELEGCTHVGTTHVSVIDHLDEMQAEEGRVAEALLSLARNSALQFGGDSIVEISNISEGTQSFAIFRCGSGD